MTKNIGEQGENKAEELLKVKGYTILARNWKEKWGELDIVAIDGDTLVFVEVKTLRDTHDVKPFEAVDSSKILKVKRAGKLFVEEWTKVTQQTLPPVSRVDVISIELDTGRVEHFEAVDFENCF